MIDWQLSKPRIHSPSSLKVMSDCSVSGSSNITPSPTDGLRYMSVGNLRHAAPQARSMNGRSSELAAEESRARFEREFIELAEVGSGEFGKVIKAQRKTGNDSEVFAIKKSKRFEGVKHRWVHVRKGNIPLLINIIDR